MTARRWVAFHFRARRSAGPVRSFGVVRRGSEARSLSPRVGGIPRGRDLFLTARIITVGAGGHRISGGVCCNRGGGVVQRQSRGDEYAVPGDLGVDR